MTMVTTSQSAIAADLDAFSSATWLTSSFLVCFIRLFDVCAKSYK